MIEEVLSFWFQELKPAQWWRVDPELDAQIRERFGPVLMTARAGELDGWRRSPEGCLAEIIVLDQFSRNIHRGTPEAFAADSLALALAREARAKGAAHPPPIDRLGFLGSSFLSLCRRRPA